MDVFTREFDNKCMRLHAIYKKLDAARVASINRLQSIKEELQNFIKVGIGAANNPIDIISAFTQNMLTENEKIYIFDVFREVNPSCTVNTQSVEKVAFNLDDEIARIESLYQDVFSEMGQIKESILQDTTAIEGYVLAKEAMKLKMLELQEQSARYMDDLLKDQEQVAMETDMPEDDRILKLGELTQRIEELEMECKDNIANIKNNIKILDSNIEKIIEEAEQKIGKFEGLQPFKTLQKTTVSKTDSALNLELKIQSIESQINLLEKQTFHRPSETAAANIKIGELLEQLQALRKQEQLKKYESFLEKKGLKVTSNAVFMNAAGNIVTEQEARDLGLLEGVPSEILMELFNSHKGPSTGNADSTSSSESAKSMMSSEDVDYLKKTIGKPLTLALAEITAKQPRDPIHYLAHWLIKYRYNQDLDIMQSKEVEELTAERTRIAQEALRRIIEAEARQAILDIIIRVEHTVLEKEMKARALALAEEEEEEEEIQYEEFIPAT